MTRKKTLLYYTFIKQASLDLIPLGGCPFCVRQDLVDGKLGGQAVFFLSERKVLTNKF